MFQQILGPFFWGQSLVVSQLGNGERNLCRNFPDFGQARVDATQFEIVRCHLRCQRFGGRKKHFIGNAGRTAGEHTQTDSRENIGVVALSGDKRPTSVVDRIKRAATGKNRFALGVFVRVPAPSTRFWKLDWTRQR